MSFLVSLHRAVGAAAIATCMAVVTPAAHAQTVPGTRYAVGANPAAIAVNPITNKVYVANADSNSVTVINATTHATKTVPVGDHPSWVAINAENNTIYVGILGGKIDIIDGATDTVIAITTAGGAGAMAINPLVDTTYVARYLDNMVDVIVGEQYQASSATRSRGPLALAINPINNWLYVAHRTSGDVVAMDVTTPQAYPPLKCPDGNGGFRAQPPPPPSGSSDTWNIPCINMPGSPVAVAINPITNLAYVITDSPTWQVAVIDGDNSTFAALSVPGNLGTPKTIAANPVTNEIWAAFSSAVLKIDGSTNAVTTFPAGTSGGGPAAIGIEVFRNMVYVANSDGTLLAIDAANSTTEVVSIAPGANGIAVNDLTRQIYVLGPTGVTEVSGAPGSAGTNKSTGITTTITPLPNDVSAPSGSIIVHASSAWPAPLAVRKVYFRTDNGTGPWSEATPAGPGTWTASYSGLAPGAHNFSAFATNGMEAPSVSTDLATVPIHGNRASYTFTVPAADSRDLAVTQVSNMSSGDSGKDVIYTVTVTNNGPGAATSVKLTDDPRNAAGVTFVWASPGCSVSLATGSPVVTCNIGTLAEGASAVVKVVLRSQAAGYIINNVSVKGAEPDPASGNDYGAINTPITASPAGVAVIRYRLYSPVTQEHLFTTDKNEYDTLGAQSGAWKQEGEAGKVLNNPGLFNGVTAVPYYRLYNTQTRWHHWTTDANEYYTLIQGAPFTPEGVDGYVLPTNTTGATQLYRLVYPDGRGLHHWTIDAAEYNSLIATYGWVGEGGAGYVIQ